MAGCGLVHYGWSVRGVAGWTGATTASAVIAWAALQPVLDAAVPDRFTPLTGAELRAEPVAGPPGFPAPAGIVIPGDGATPEASQDGGDAESATGADPAGSPDGPGEDDGSASSDGGSASGADEDEPPAEPSEPPAEPEVTEDGWTVLESADGTSYVKTFDTRGGTATIEVEPGLATLLSATPVEPYAVEVHHEDPERVVVQFYVTNQMYVVEGMWWEGRPYGNVTEVPE